MIELSRQAGKLVVSVICLPELLATLSRLVREKRLTRTGYRKLKACVLADLHDIDVCQITSAVLESSVALLESHPLRSLDAMHVACALAVKADVFVSADQRQLAAAKRSDLNVVDLS